MAVNVFRPDLREVARIMGDSFGDRAQLILIHHALGILFRLVVPGPNGTQYSRSWMVLYSDLERGGVVGSSFINDFRRHVRFLRGVLDTAIASQCPQPAEGLTVRVDTAEPVTKPDSAVVINFNEAVSRMKNRKGEKS